MRRKKAAVLMNRRFFQLDLLALIGTASGSTNFTDVASDAFYADAISWAVANNVTNGTSNTTFSPNADCTRAEIVTFLYRAYQGK